MDLQTRINSFHLLGRFLEQFTENRKNNFLENLNHMHYNKIEGHIQSEHTLNAWFTEENIRSSLKGIVSFLDQDKLTEWVKNYHIKENINSKKVGLVMAGNIPMVGFHDLLCVLISGNPAICKLSSKDNRLFKAIIEVLYTINNDFGKYIQFTEDRLTGFDAVIATGSNNTSRYFEYYFGKYPHIIRKNRNSLAILTGNESGEDIKNLAKDIFMYFGLGCRNVSKLIVPAGYHFDFFFENIEHYHHLLSHNKYMNNHDYNSSVYLLSLVKHLDNGFLIVKEELSLSSPIGVLYFHTYQKTDEINRFIHENRENIQCIVSALHNFPFETIPFGKSQLPGLMDYADHVDTMNFLSALNER